MCFKSTSLKLAYDNGLRHCPICKLQLVWKPNLQLQQKNLATVDHIVPRSIGGADAVNNMFVMCRKCNERRGNTCFVTYLFEHGFSKSYAETLYKTAHIASLQLIIFNQFTQLGSGIEKITTVSKLRRKQVKLIINNYKTYFKDYLPEFELLQRICK